MVTATALGERMSTATGQRHGDGELALSDGELALSVPAPPKGEPDPLLTRGRCAVCGIVGEFVDVGRSLPGNWRCPTCRASLRYRWQARILVDLYAPGAPSLREAAAAGCFADLDVYEPGVIGPIRRHLRRSSRYVNSYLWDDVPRGEVHEGARSEDLQALTFEEASFDLVVTSDIFEHVPDPWAGFAEVHRVLRPGGRHVFTVPLPWPFAATRSRAVLTGGEVRHLLRPIYHGSPGGSRGSLVFTDFGPDLVESLHAVGFRTTMHHACRNVATFVSTREPDESAAAPPAAD